MGAGDPSLAPTGPTGRVTSPRKGSPRKRQPAYWPWLLAGGVIVTFILFVVLITRQPRSVRVGDHWHARLTIELCGKILPPLPPAPGDVHTHGDGVIHIHPETSISAGRNATLGRFFRTTPVQISGTSIAVGRDSYKNGDACPDGKTGTLRVLSRVSRARELRPRRDFLRYRPRDGDEVRVVFGP